MPKVVSSVEEYWAEIDSAAEHLVIVEYFTTWCTQCPKTVPWLEELEQKYEHAIFLRVDCDVLPKLVSFEKIKAVPSFYFFKNNKRIYKLAGAFKDRLFETTEELSMKRTVRSKTSSPTITSSMANVSVPDTASEQTVDQPADQAADETVEQAVEENIADENNNDNEKVLDEV